MLFSFSPHTLDLERMERMKRLKREPARPSESDDQADHAHRGRMINPMIRYSGYLTFLQEAIYVARKSRAHQYVSLRAPVL